MQDIRTDNAITRRIDQLQIMWEQFRAIPTARYCCWLVPQDALTMIDTFYQVNADESSSTPDIFLRFETPFINAKSYGKALSEELSALVEDDRVALAEDDIFIEWQTTHTEDANNVAVGFLRNFFHFAESLDIDDRVVAFISPSSIANAGAWEKWWTDVLSLSLPEKINFMVCDTEGSEVFQKMAKKYPDKFILFRPKLEMANAIRELMVEYGDQDDNCTHFRKAFFELTQVVPSKDATEIQQRAKTALALARQIGYPHLEITVLCTAATGFNLASKPVAANTAYDEALKIADAQKGKPLIKEFPEMKVDLPGGDIFEQLAVQVLFFKASGFIAATPPQYEQALAAYQQAEERLILMTADKKMTEQMDWTNGGIPNFHRLEALRMTGYCNEKLGRRQQALKIYAKAVTLAEAMSPEMRQNTMLPFIGQSMLDICQSQAMKQEYWTVSEKMNILLGKGWEQSLPKAA